MLVLQEETNNKLPRDRGEIPTTTREERLTRSALKAEKSLQGKPLKLVSSVNMSNAPLQPCPRWSICNHEVILFLSVSHIRTHADQRVNSIGRFSFFFPSHFPSVASYSASWNRRCEVEEAQIHWWLTWKRQENDEKKRRNEERNEKSKERKRNQNNKTIMPIREILFEHLKYPMMQMPSYQ